MVIYFCHDFFLFWWFVAKLFAFQSVFDGSFSSDETLKSSEVTASALDSCYCTWSATVAGLLHDIFYRLLLLCFHLSVGKLSMWWSPQSSSRTPTCPSIWEWREWIRYVDSNISCNIFCLLLICLLDMPSLWPSLVDW